MSRNVKTPGPFMRFSDVDDVDHHLVAIGGGLVRATYKASGGDVYHRYAPYVQTPIEEHLQAEMTPAELINWARAKPRVFWRPPTAWKIEPDDLRDVLEIPWIKRDILQRAKAGVGAEQIASVYDRYFLTRFSERLISISGATVAGYLNQWSCVDD